MFNAWMRVIDGLKQKGRAKRRAPWVAVLLSLCPGLGQHYAGHIVRGIVIYIAFIVISWLAAIGFMFIEHRLSMVLLGVPFVAAAWVAWDAYRCARRQAADYRLQWFNRVWVYAGVTLALMLTVNPLMDQAVGKHVVRAFFVTSTGMEPAVVEHDIVLINKWAEAQRGSIVLIDLSGGQGATPLSSLIDDQLIKRAVALAGDSIEIRGREVYVNGQRLDETYTDHQGQAHSVRVRWDDYRFGPAIVPEGHLFMLGDKRSVGIDSRYLGFIAEGTIAGVVSKVFWSWNLAEGHFKWERTALSF